MEELLIGELSDHSIVITTIATDSRRITLIFALNARRKFDIGVILVSTSWHHQHYQPLVLVLYRGHQQKEDEFNVGLQFSLSNCLLNRFGQ